MKSIGLIITIIGFIGVVYFGIDLLTNDAEVNVLGLEVTVKERDYTPLIISALVLIVGVLVVLRKNKL